jgi:hypothetical protein
VPTEMLRVTAGLCLPLILKAQGAERHTCTRLVHMCECGKTMQCPPTLGTMDTYGSLAGLWHGSLAHGFLSRYMLQAVGHGS